jgi:HD-GYP domain-containing protein (c-di-GMP phosphodiesterase class II)
MCSRFDRVSLLLLYMPHHDLRIWPLLHRTYWLGGAAIIALTLTAVATFESDRRGDRDVIVAFNRTRLGRDVQVIALEREERRTALAPDSTLGVTSLDEERTRSLKAKVDSLISLEMPSSAEDSVARAVRARLAKVDSGVVGIARNGTEAVRRAAVTTAFTEAENEFAELRRLEDIALTSATSDDVWARAAWVGSVVIELLGILGALFWAHRIVLQNVAAVMESQHEVLDRLAAAGEYRDDETGQHTRRVGELAGRIARMMGYGGDTIATIRRASALHDVGKIGVPDGILLKEGRLTPEELEVMRQHTIMGAHILEGGHSVVVSAAARIARSHHEWWNGTGYPDQLAGEQIPIEARITAVADVFGAIRSKRSYRDAFALEVCLEEIRRGAGTHFDPSVVKAFFDGRCYEGYAVEGGGSQDANTVPLIRQLVAKVAKPAREGGECATRPVSAPTLTLS